MKQLTLPKRKPVPTSVSGSRCQVVGQLRAEATAIFVHEATLERILDFSHRELMREIGGFLLGGVFIDERPYIEVRGFLPANNTRSDSASLRFTHQTWARLNRVVEERFPDETVLGWHHTHPGMGVFLSGHDLFIHRNFFAQPWQIAMVVDPRQGCFSFFQWCHDWVVDCGFVCVSPKR